MAFDFGKENFYPRTAGESLDRQNRPSRDLMAEENSIDEDEERINANDPEHKFVPIEEVPAPEEDLDGVIDQETKVEVAPEPLSDEDDLESAYRAFNGDVAPSQYPEEFTEINKGQGPIESASVDAKNMEITYVRENTPENGEIETKTVGKIDTDQDFSKVETENKDNFRRIKGRKIFTKEPWNYDPPRDTSKDNMKTMPQSKLERMSRKFLRKLLGKRTND
jgi:hypothetical protein